MKKLLFLLTLIVALLAGAILLFAAAKPTNQQAIFQSPGSSSSPVGIEDAIQQGIPFRVYFPETNSYNISANPELMHSNGGVVYAVAPLLEKSLIVVSEGVVSSTMAHQFQTADQLRQKGSVDTISVDGATGYVGTIMKGLSAGHAEHVFVFTQSNVVIELSTFDAVDTASLVQLARSMK